jgi:hypothetical protein
MHAKSGEQRRYHKIFAMKREQWVGWGWEPCSRIIFNGKKIY